MPVEPILEDRRTLELRYRMPILHIHNFFSGLEEGKVRGTRCKDCGSLYFPPQSDCSNCRGSEMEWMDLEGDATLETFTVIEVAPTSFADRGSYVVAVGLLKEGVRVLAWLNTADRDKLRVGAKIGLRSVKREEGYFSYEFFLEE